MALVTDIPGLAAALSNIIDKGSNDGRDPDADGVRGTYLDLPFTQEFRVEVTEATYKHSQAGNEGIRFVLTITADSNSEQPPQYVGQKIWGGVYFTGHEMQAQILATLLAASGITEPVTVEQAAARIVGARLIVALKEGNDPRYPETRWINVDRGQKLSMKVSPQKPKGGAAAGPLVAAPPIPQAVAQAVVAPPAAAPAAAAPAATASLSGIRPAGIKLPGAGA